MHHKEFIKEIFERRGNEVYAGEKVTQLEHALQCAHFAQKETSDKDLILAALLHDFGHIFEKNKNLPNSLDENLDDKHEIIAYKWLSENINDRVAELAKLHVAAKRYLCTVDQEYYKNLSPISQKSFQDQGGFMNEDELNNFKSTPYSKDAIRLRIWDDKAKVPNLKTKNLNEYLILL